MSTTPAGAVGAPPAKTPIPGQIPYIIGNEGCERFSFYGRSFPARLTADGIQYRTIMHRPLLILLVSVVAGLAQDTARMNEVVKAQTAGDRFMGSVLVAKNGAIVFEQSCGWANIEWKIPHTVATKFRIGSVTKQFTAAAILLLEERGRLTLHDSLSKFIPSAPPAWKPVTLHQLLTHTSGIPSFTGLPEYATRKLSPESPAQMMAHISDKPLDFTPGEKFKARPWWSARPSPSRGRRWSRMSAPTNSGPASILRSRWRATSS